MNKYFKYFYLIGIFFICITVSTSLFSQEKQNAVLQEAQNKLAYFLEKIPQGMESEYGFNSRWDFNEAKLLNPINIILPSDDFYNSNVLDTVMINYFSSRHWNIPISVDDNICCFLHGHFTENNFNVFTIGGNKIAEQFNTLYNGKPNFKNIQQSVIFFPSIKKSYLILYDNNMIHYDSKCISLDESFDSNIIKEQSMYEIFTQCKFNLVQEKLRKNEY